MHFPAISAAIVLAGLVQSTLAKEPLPLPTNQVSVELAAPPLEGTVSIGVFDSAGKCLRVLYKNTPSANIPSALNGFSITWDGKTEAGTVAPTGNYEIRGITVGDIAIEGKAYHFNDWIDGENPTDLPRQTLRIELLDEGFRAWQTFADARKIIRFDQQGNRVGEAENFTELPATNAASRGSTSVSIKDGNAVYSGSPENGTQLDLPEVGQILDIAVGREGAFWLITKSTENAANQLREYSLEGEFLRELDPEKGEIFDHVAASENDEKIALISRLDDGERVRIITQATPTADSVSLWKTLLEKKIQPCHDFGMESKTGNLIPNGNLPAENAIAISLIENPLTPDQKTSLELQPASLADGLWLTTKSGLPIVQIASEMTSKRLAIVRGKTHDALRFYAGIEGAVAEFSISGLSNMMQFTSEKIPWPPSPRQTADDQNLPSNEPAPTPEN